MSTRKIRSFLEDALSQGGMIGGRAQEALKELGAIEQAARNIAHGGGAEALRDADYDTSVDLLVQIAKEAP